MQFFTVQLPFEFASSWRQLSLEHISSQRRVIRLELSWLSLVTLREDSNVQAEDRYLDAAYASGTLQHHAQEVSDG